MRFRSLLPPRILGAFTLLLLSQNCCAQAPGTAQKAPEKKAEPTAAAAEPQLPAQIELLETHVRFETNGDSRKEVRTRAHINNEVGVQQFARLNFNFNRTFESVEIPFVRITHARGGTADILPSAISDNPDPAVVDFPAYQDVRVKSVRILGLEPGDLLEYRVITSVSHHPLAPDFWLDHTFDRSGVVAHETFELDLPASRKPEIRINPETPAKAIEKSGEGENARAIYRWERAVDLAKAKGDSSVKESEQLKSDVALSTLSAQQWETLSIKLDEKLTPGAKPLETINSYEESMQELKRRYHVAPEIMAKASELAKEAKTNRDKLEAIYDFVSQKIRTVDLAFGANGFLAKPPSDLLSAGYATAEDKFVLFAALAASLKLGAEAALTGYCDEKGPARPSAFTHLLISGYDGETSYWLDPSLEVAPFGLISPNSGKCAFILNRSFFAMNSTGHEWQKLVPSPPFPAVQRVVVSATLGNEGQLDAKVRYSMRGENELLLRVAFHQSSKEKWKDLAQLLALSDGFRGKVTNVTASDPYATHEPFAVEYEITTPKFVDWSKQPVRIPALLPQVALPDPPTRPAAGAAAAPVELGTPLDVETHVTLHLPAGTTARVPIGASVERDYATFASKYAANGLTLTASRHVHFLLREVPASRIADYNAFLHAVQSDQAQDFTLERAESSPAKTQPAAHKPAAQGKP